jgi:hypothetical protein
MTKKRRTLSIVLLGVTAVAIVGAAWFFFPWPDKTYRVWNGFGYNRATEERRFRWVPKGNPEGIPGRDRMFFTQRLEIDGPTWGSGTTRRFGFFEMTDAKWITNEK